MMVLTCNVLLCFVMESLFVQLILVSLLCEINLVRYGLVMVSFLVLEGVSNLIAFSNRHNLVSVVLVN